MSYPRRLSLLACLAVALLLSSSASPAPAAQHTLDDLLRALRDRDPRVRLQAADRLGQLGPKGVGALPALIVALKDPDAAVRNRVAWALGTLGPQGKAAVPALVDAMIQVDGRWDHLKSIAAAGFRPPADHPDLDPPHEALQLSEHFRELRRLEESQHRGPAFLARLTTAEHHALSLRDALRALPASPPADRLAAIKTTFDAVGNDCRSCHAMNAADLANASPACFTVLPIIS